MIYCYYYVGVQRRVLQSCGLNAVSEDFLPSEEGNPHENTQQSYLEFLGMKLVRFKDLLCPINHHLHYKNAGTSKENTGIVLFIHQHIRSFILYQDKKISTMVFSQVQYLGSGTLCWALARNESLNK